MRSLIREYIFQFSYENTVIKEVVGIYKGGRETDKRPKCVKERIVFSLFISPPHRSTFARRNFCSTTWTRTTATPFSLLEGTYYPRAGKTDSPDIARAVDIPHPASYPGIDRACFLQVQQCRIDDHRGINLIHLDTLPISLFCGACLGWPLSSRALSLNSLLSTLPFDSLSRVSAFEISFVDFNYQRGGWKRERKLLREKEIYSWDIDGTIGIEKVDRQWDTGKKVRKYCESYRFAIGV